MQEALKVLLCRCSYSKTRRHKLDTREVDVYKTDVYPIDISNGYVLDI